MSQMLASLTVRVLLALSIKATVLVLLATALAALGYDMPYLTELLGFEGAMFAAVTAKNGADNFIAYRRETTAIAAGVAYDPTPPR